MKRRLPKRSACAVAIMLAAAPAALGQDMRNYCRTCITIRVGPPVVLRGPGPEDPDAPFSLIKLPNERFRGFSANGTTYAIDGRTPFDMGGDKRAVLTPGPKGSPSECGRWLTAIIRDGQAVRGLVHNENCTHGEAPSKSMSIAWSSDDGLSWSDGGQIIAGPDAKSGNGIGDCTGIDGNDGNLYAYCLRQRDNRVVVARAPKSDPAPGEWKQWDGRNFTVPALGGDGTPLEGFPGHSAAYWATQSLFALMTSSDAALKLYLSTDRIHFSALGEPLLLTGDGTWKRPAPTALFAYESLSDISGTNRISDSALLSYLYLPPGADFSQRYLVMHEIRLKMTDAPASPQVRVALSRFAGPEGEPRWTTTAPPIARDSGKAYKFERPLGYVMTAQPVWPSVKLDECTRNAAGRRDHLIAPADSCLDRSYETTRALGYVFRDQRPGTIPLFVCAAPDQTHFASNDPACEKLGKTLRRLGFVLRD